MNRAKLMRVTLLDSKTFLTLALHASARDEVCQTPKITEEEAVAELALDVKRAEIRQLMEAA